MRRLTILVAVLAAIYGGYWFVGASTVENAARGGLVQMQSEGWDVSYDTLNTRGFPSRFDTTITDISLKSPDGANSYASEIVQVLALSYQPNNVIAALPSLQNITLANVPLIIESTGMRANIDLAPNTNLSLRTLTGEATKVTIKGEDGAAQSLNAPLIALRNNASAPHRYDIFVSARDIDIPPAVLAQIDPEMGAIETFQIEATVDLDRDLDRHSLPVWDTDPGELRGFKLTTLDLMWGEFIISGAGDLRVADNGVADGTITIEITGWRDMLDLALDAGLIPANMQFIAQSMGETLSEGADSLSFPITFANGNLSVGPLPLGPAPRFH